MTAVKKSEILAALQSDILRLQGFKSSSSLHTGPALGPILRSMPNGIFPTGSIHEFIISSHEDSASASGFIGGIIRELLNENGAALWISTSRSIFPPSLKTFGIDPDRIIFIDLKNEKEVLWVMEESLKCEALTAVIAEVKDLSFTASRRLQLSVEKSNVTGFVLRNSRRPGTTACVSRWMIESAPSANIPAGKDFLPGIGYPKWRVSLLRIRNGRPGTWEVFWSGGRFQFMDIKSAIGEHFHQQTG